MSRTSVDRKGWRAACWVTAVTAVSLALGGCSGEPARKNGEKLQVVTTVAPLTSIIASVGGGRIEVDGLVPEGVNSHTFEPPPSASRSFANADVIFINGLKLEDPTRELADRTKRSDVAVVELGTSALPETDYIFDFSFPKEDGKPNPHLWTDPTYAVRYAEKVRDVLTELDPDGATVYRESTATFVAQANALTEAIRADQESLPADQRELLTYHDAYAYFARTFGWRVVGAIQPRNFEDPTPREIVGLIDQVRREEVKVIFGSEVFPSRVLEQIGKATGARYVDVLRDDDLPGKPGESEHSWLGLMRFDYLTMIEALGGSAPRLRALDVNQAGADHARYAQ